MLCQKCKERVATVFYKQSFNGISEEIALCSHCAAKEQGAFGAGFSLFDGLFGGRAVSRTAKRCTFCGSTWAQIAESGKPGCAKCYEHFAAELAPTIAAMHGAGATYQGRAPEKAEPETPAPDPTAEKLTALRAELAEAVTREDYERAAVLRDQIKELEKGGA